MKYKWILFGAAVLMIAVNLLTSDLSVYKQLSPTDLLPVLAIALLSFLLKAGTLSAIFLGFKKLWKWITKKR